MTGHSARHRAVLTLDETVPPEVPVGTVIALKIELACSDGCPLDNRTVSLVAEDMHVACERGLIAVAAPARLGAFTWHLVSPPQEVDGILHEPVSVRVSFATRPLSTSLAVWDVPSPVVIGTRFTVKVGAKSSGDCSLEGATVELLDDDGVVIGSGQLGHDAWEGTGALQWTEVELPAPVREGIVTWSARFPAMELGMPHGQSAASFSVAAVRRPDHRLTITFTDDQTEKPIENAHIRLGPFRAITNACGQAEVLVPGGTYEVKVWHPGYEAPATSLDVQGDLALRLAGSALPEEDQSARWMM